MVTQTKYQHTARSCSTCKSYFLTCENLEPGVTSDLPDGVLALEPHPDELNMREAKVSNILPKCTVIKKHQWQDTHIIKQFKGIQGDQYTNEKHGRLSFTCSPRRSHTRQRRLGALGDQLRCSQ